MPGIIVGVDGSANAKPALDWAIGEAAIRRAPLTVITVHEISHSFWSGRPVVLGADEDQLAEARKAATDMTDEALAEHGQAKPTLVTVVACNGFAADELIKASESADLVVVGARGGAQLGGLAAHSPIGSISTKVLHSAKCPVVVVPPKS
jgi:nucleotide-binding universal stress UspA family protein